MGVLVTGKNRCKNGMVFLDHAILLKMVCTPDSFLFLLDHRGFRNDNGHDQVSDQDTRPGQEESQHKQ